MVVAILTPDRVPQPCHHREERRVHERELASGAIGGIGRKHRQEGQHAHLDEDDGAGPPVLSSMELQVERPVDPSDPDQAEDDGELDEPTRRDVFGDVMSRLSDDGDVHEVVEELEEADGSPGDRLAMCSRRSPEPTLEAPADCVIGHRVNVPTRRPVGLKP